MNALVLSTRRHAPFLRCDGTCAPGECVVIDAREIAQAPRPFPTAVVQSPFTRRALGSTLPAKAVRS